VAGGGCSGGEEGGQAGLRDAAHVFQWAVTARIRQMHAPRHLQPPIAQRRPAQLAAGAPPSRRRRWLPHCPVCPVQCFLTAQDPAPTALRRGGTSVCVKTTLSSSKASDQCAATPHLHCTGPAAAVKRDLAGIHPFLGCGSFERLLPGFHLLVLHKAGLNGRTAASGMLW
jgi:hypothetical protein